MICHRKNKVVIPLSTLPLPPTMAVSSVRKVVVVVVVAAVEGG